MKDWHIRPETIKLLEENIGSKHLDISLGNDFFFFLDLTPNAKATTKKVGLHKTKIFCTEKETNTMKKSNLLNRRKYVQIISD